MKFYIGDKVRMLDGCNILLDNPVMDTESSSAGKGRIFTVDGIVKYSQGRIGLHLEEAAHNCDYDKRGFELVKRGPNAPKRKRKAKAKKPTLRFKVGDKVQTKSGLVEDEKYGSLHFHSSMKAEGVIKIADDLDRTYLLEGKPFWYSEEMLEGAPETTEEPTPKFKVGDRVIGNSEERYAITKKGWIGTVVRADGFSIDVEEAYSADSRGEAMVYSDLEPEYFDLYTGDPKKAEEITGKPKEGKTLERGELVKTFFEVATEDGPLKDLITKMLLLFPAFAIMMKEVEDKLLGDK